MVEKGNMSSLERLCVEQKMKMTEQRRVIAKVISDSVDHPDVEELYRRSSEMDPKISISTVYRTVRLFEAAGLLERLDIGDGRARYEQTSQDHHDHLIDTKSGKIIEFHDEELELLQEKIAGDLGYKLVGHRMELFGVSLGDKEKNSES